jgi:putative flippase GtrA
MLRSVRNYGSSEAGRMARFLVVGLGNTLIGLASYGLLLELGVSYALAGAIAWTLGTLNGYHWNRIWTFSRADHRAAMMTKYLLVGLLGLILNSSLLVLFVAVIGVDEFVAELAALPFVALITFGLNRFWTFGSHLRSIEAAPPAAPEGEELRLGQSR